MPTLELTHDQFDKLEEAADVLALGHVYVSTLSEAVGIVAEEYIRIFGPLYEVESMPVAEGNEEEKPLSN